ncbi:mechanosensitive ion channel family protein [Leeia oryzae]|uniref:mechanosensitive ion channel family protein n=1 Tax=Leeia oryzae TaxID=356662 RepID=UPI00039EDC93|nr:mechanosensitive ion channel family protein [Leeia oryzae]
MDVLLSYLSEALLGVSHISSAAIRILFIMIVAWLAISTTQKSIIALRVRIASSMDDAETIKRTETIGRVLRYLIAVIISLIAAMLILSELGVSVAPILGAAGVVGLAVGFGAQSLVKDYFNGFFILIENQIRQGDVIGVDGHEGFVEEVTLRYVQLRDYDGNVHFLPNSTISTVVNKTRGFAYAVVTVCIGYEEDIDRAMSVMNDVASVLQKDELLGPKILENFEMAGVDQLGESGIVLKGRFKVLPLQQWAIKREYLKRIKYAFDQQHITFPFPQLTVHQA